MNNAKTANVRKITVLISAIAVIVVCLAVAVGATFAVLANDTRISIPLKGANLDIDASITSYELYSAQAAADGDMTVGGAKYKYVSRGKSDTFANGGTATISSDSAIALDKISAGDKLMFGIELKNNSEVAAKYSVNFTLADQQTNKLFDNMDISVKLGDGEEQIVSAFRTDDTAHKSARTDWRELEKGESDSITIGIALPVTAGNDVQKLSANILCTLSAVQWFEGDSIPVANVYDADGNPVMDGENAKGYESLAEAIEEAPEGGTVDIIRGDTSSAAGKNITVDKSITLQSGTGDMFAYKDLHFNVTDGRALTLKKLRLEGDSYINASHAAALTLTDCEFVGKPSKMFDEATRTYLDKAGFVVANGVQQAGVELKIENTKFVTENADGDMAAVYLDTAVSDGSAITGNTFGAQGAASAFSASAVWINSAISGARISIGDNEFYMADGVAALALGQNENRAAEMYRVISTANSVHGNMLAKTERSAYIAFTDSRSKIGDADVSFDALDMAHNSLFAALDARLDVNNRLTSGRVKLFNGYTEEAFRAAFAASSADITIEA